MHESSSPSHNFLTLADIVGVYGIKGWVRLRVRLDEPNLLLSLPDLTLVAAPDAPRSARQSVVVEALQPASDRVRIRGDLVHQGGP